jgi:hypothetical protein
MLRDKELRVRSDQILSNFVRAAAAPWATEPEVQPKPAPSSFSELPFTKLKSSMPLTEVKINSQSLLCKSRKCW